MLKINSEKKKRKKAVFSSLFAIFVLFVLYFVFVSDFFKVKSVSVSGNKISSAEEIKKSFSFSFIFSPYKTSALPPEIREATVLKNFFSRDVVIEVKERTPFALWCFGGENSKTCRWFDETGFVFMNSPSTKGAFIKSVLSDREVKVGEYVFNETIFKNFKDILEIFDGINVSPSRFETGDSKNEELTAFVDNLPIFFNLRLNQEFTKEALISLKSKFSGLVYIDLRSENKAFYKNK